MFRKSLVVISSFLIAFTGFTVPALADPQLITDRISAGGLNTSQNFLIYAGEENRIVYRCEDDDPYSINTVTTNEWDPISALPPGMTYDSTDMSISGIATTPGVYPLPQVSCHVEANGQATDILVSAATIEVMRPPYDPARTNITAGGHTSTSNETLAVGTYYDIDYSCVDSDPWRYTTVTTQSWTPNIPEGMTLDSTTFHITGTPSSQGIYLLGSMSCFADFGNNGHSIVVQTGSITVVDTSNPYVIDDSQITAGGHTSMTTEIIHVGDTVDINYACQDDGQNSPNQVSTVGWLSTPELPAGLELLSTNYRLVGTPTQTGYFFIPMLICHIDAYGVSTEAPRAAGAIQVLEAVLPPVDEDIPPAADLHVNVLHDGLCRFNIDIFYPIGYAPDDGSPRLFIGDDDAEDSLTLIGRDPGYHSNQTFSMRDFSGSFPSDGDWENPAPEYDFFDCGDSLTFRLTYEVDGVDSESAEVHNVIIAGEGGNFIDAFKSFNNGKCYVDFEVWIADQTAPDQDSIESTALISYFDWGHEATFGLALTDIIIGSGGLFSYDTHARNVPNESKEMYSTDVVYRSSTGQVDCAKGGMATLEIKLSNGYPMTYYFEVAALQTCGKGYYSQTGFSQFEPCQEAPIGSYVNQTQATSYRQCPSGMTTETTASASFYDCFKPIVQTFKTLAALKKMKIGKSFILPNTTDQGVSLRIRPAGACTVLPYTVNNVQKVKLVASKKAGTCTLTLESPTFGRFAAVSKSMTVKVTKTGK